MLNMYLFGVSLLCCMEAKHELYRKKYRKKDIWRLEAFEIWMLRRVMKVSLTEYRTNEEVLQMVEAETEIIDTLRSRQKRWMVTP